MNRVVRWPLALALAVACAAPLAADEAGLRQLVDASPFGMKADTGTAKPETAAVEFRGYFRDGKEMCFSVYDAVNGRGVWLRLNEALGDIVVRQFEPSTEVLSIERNGRVQDLALKAVTSAAGRASLASPTAKPNSVAFAVAPEATVAAAPGSVVEAAELQLEAARQQQAYQDRRQRAMERVNAVRAKTPAKK